MEKEYIAPNLCRVPLCLNKIICSSGNPRLEEKEGVRGDEAESRPFSKIPFWDDINDSDE